MTIMITSEVHFRQGHGTRKVLKDDRVPEDKPLSPGTTPRISRLMALAIRFERLIAEGAVAQSA